MNVSRPRLWAIEDTIAQLGKERGAGPGQGDTYTRQSFGEARRGDRQAREEDQCFQTADDRSGGGEENRASTI
jgi:hypothetical protein